MITKTQQNVYNDEGQCISKTENGVKTSYYYEGSNVIYTTDADGNKTSLNIYGLDENVIATIHYENDGQHAYTYHKDIQGSTSAVVDEAGCFVVGYEYDDFGETEKIGDSTFYNEICYTGAVYDELTGLHYLNARYYNPDEATFLSQDTYRGDKTDYGTWNLYGYCAGNPIKYVDPSGHWFETIWDIGSALYSIKEAVCNPSWGNTVWAVADTGAAALPFVPATGGIKIVGKVDDAVKYVAKKGDEVVKTVKNSKIVKAASKKVKNAKKKVSEAIDKVTSGSKNPKNSKAPKNKKSSNKKGNSSASTPDYVKNKRVPQDKETILSGKEFKKTGKKVKGAQVYKKGDKYYYRDTFHTGEAAHIEVFDKKGRHLGEANPVTGKLKEGTADSTKRINVK